MDDMIPEPGGTIRAELGRRRLSVPWLAEQVGVSAPTMHTRLASAGTFRLEELAVVGELLSLDSTDLYTKWLRARSEFTAATGRPPAHTTEEVAS